MTTVMAAAAAASSNPHVAETHKPCRSCGRRCLQGGRPGRCPQAQKKRCRTARRDTLGPRPRRPRPIKASPARTPRRQSTGALYPDLWRRRRRCARDLATRRNGREATPGRPPTLRDARPRETERAVRTVLRVRAPWRRETDGTPGAQAHREGRSTRHPRLHRAPPRRRASWTGTDGPTLQGGSDPRGGTPRPPSPGRAARRQSAQEAQRRPARRRRQEHHAPRRRHLGRAHQEEEEQHLGGAPLSPPAQPPPPP